MKLSFPTNKKYGEAGQALPISFCLGQVFRDEFRGFHALTKCRDFFCDAIHAINHKKPTSAPIYGFSIDTKQYDSHEPLAFLVSGVKLPEEKIRQNLQLLFMYENKHNLPPSGIVDIFEDKIILSVGELWTFYEWAFSLWSMIVKICCYYDDPKAKTLKEFLESLLKNHKRGNEWHIINSIGPELFKILRNIQHLFAKLPNFRWEPNDDITCIHHYSGILSQGQVLRTKQFEGGAKRLHFDQEFVRIIEEHEKAA